MRVRLTSVNEGPKAGAYRPDMDDHLIERYGGPVPRYTSYPTAPHFHAGVTADSYAEWLRELATDAPSSLYIHIPFCKQLCWYCGCHTKVANRAEPVRRYVETLNREIGLVADSLPGRLRAGHIHWGGGTPTILDEDGIARLAAGLNRHFDIDAEAEFAVEADPRNLTPAKATALAEAGVNRVSLGVQDFSPVVQCAINREQGFEVVEEAVHALRDAGIDAINIDLMYGLPHQTVDDVERSVDLAAHLSPDRLAIFGYAHVPWMKTNQKLIDDAALPGTRDRMDQAQTARDRLKVRGYRRIGLDHFARPDDAMAMALDAGTLSRNFQGYTTDAAETLLGFGASAIGRLPRGYVKNQLDTRTYEQTVHDGALPIAGGIALSDDDRLRRAVIERLMCDEAVDLKAVAAGFGQDLSVFAPEAAALAPFLHDGLVTFENGDLGMTDRGRPFVRAAAALFDRYLQSGRARHSKAV